jgi:FAD/FMN-containing dehydrogenase
MKRRAFVRSTLTAAIAAAVPGYRPLSALARLQDPPDVEAVTGDGKPVTLRGKRIAELAARLRGRVLLAKDEGYDQARRILNPSFDKRPALIVQPSGTADVRSAVEFAREHSLLVAVKCGGHSLSGQSTCDRGMQIDLSSFRAVRLDPAARLAWVAGGTLLGQVDHEALAHGLVTPLGTVSHTGVGGLTLGAGFGRVARRFGLAIDNLMGVEVVTADGRIVRANANENPDLYWGVRGGGGNFGVVTEFQFRLHPMERQVLGGNIVFPFERARDVLAMFGEYGARAPDDLYMDPFVVLPPGGERGVAGVNVCYSGPADRAEAALAPIRKLGAPLADEVKAIDYAALQRSGDVADPRARAPYLKGGFVSGLPADLVAAIVDRMEAHPARDTAVFFQQSGGAIGRVAPDATAFPHRAAHSNMMAAVSWKFGDDPAEHVRWIRQFWAGLERFTGGVYVNAADPDASLNANYGPNFRRMVALKNKYDPTNLFRLNANVAPAAG